MTLTVPAVAIGAAIPGRLLFTLAGVGPGSGRGRYFRLTPAWRPEDWDGNVPARQPPRPPGAQTAGLDSPARRGRRPMDSTGLRAVQQPLKDAYREDPQQAVITLRARGELGDEGISCSVDTGRAMAVAGLHPATGGDGSLLCSGDMLLEALVACAGVTLRAVATSLEIAVTGGTVRAEGDLDFRGTLGVAKDAPVGFTAIRLSFELDTDASEEQIATLLRLTERYCVVYQTLAHPVPVAVSADVTRQARREQVE